MKKLIFLLIITLIIEKSKNKISNNQKKKKFKRENTLIILNDSNFERAIKHYKKLLVIILPNHCSSLCETRKTEITEASIKLYKHKPRLNIGKLMIDESPETEKKLLVRKYPELIYFNNGKQEKFTGVFNYNGVINFMIKKSLPNVIELFTNSEIYNFKNTHYISIIYFGGEKNIINYLSNISNEDVNFYSFCNFESSLKEFNMKNNSIVLYKKFGNEKNEFYGKMTYNGLKNFIKKYSLDKILEMNEETFKIIWEDENEGLFLVHDKKNKNSKIYSNILKEFSNKVYGRIKIIESGIDFNIEKQLLPVLKITAKDLPAIRITNTSNIRRPVYEFNDIINVDNLINFLNKYENHQLYPLLRSEEILTNEEQKKYKVFKVVSKSFYNEVLTYNKSVLLFLFNNENDNKTKEVYSIIQRINEIVLNDSNINNIFRIVQIDNLRNELWEIRINNFPHIKLMKNLKDNKKDTIEYDNKEFTYNSIVNFINKHLNVNIKLEEEENKKEKKENIKEEKKEDL